MANTFVYDGLSFNIGALAGDPYLNFVYSSLIELGGIITSHFALEKYGRKIPYSICLFLAGVSLLCIQFVPTSIEKKNKLIFYFFFYYMVFNKILQALLQL